MNIKSIIKEKGFTIQEVANKIGVNRVTLTLTIQGNPTYKKMKEIADAIGCEISDFFRDETNKKAEQHKEELTALIRFRGQLYQADSIEELENVIKWIREEGER